MQCTKMPAIFNFYYMKIFASDPRYEQVNELQTMLCILKNHHIHNIGFVEYENFVGDALQQAVVEVNILDDLEHIINMDNPFFRFLTGVDT